MNISLTVICLLNSLSSVFQLWAASSLARRCGACCCTPSSSRYVNREHFIDCTFHVSALGRLKSRKKMWCVLEESQHQLLYYKDESRARHKEPDGSIDLKGAAITLDLDNENQFVIM